MEEEHISNNNNNNNNHNDNNNDNEISSKNYFNKKSMIPMWLQKVIYYVQTRTGLTHSASIGVTGTILAYILTGRAGSNAGPLSNAVGYIYPLYMTFKALKSVETFDDTQWLMYWMVFGSFNLIESFSGKLFTWLPFYTYLKCGVLVWCFLPRTRGAEVLYKKFIEPWLTQYEETIDDHASKAHDRVMSIISSASTFFPNSLSTNSVNIVEEKKEENDNDVV